MEVKVNKLTPVILTNARNTIHLFQLVRNPGKCNVSNDKSLRYYDNDDWPAHAPVGMREWRLRKEPLKNIKKYNYGVKI